MRKLVISLDDALLADLDFIRKAGHNPDRATAVAVAIAATADRWRQRLKPDHQPK